MYNNKLQHADDNAMFHRFQDIERAIEKNGMNADGSVDLEFKNGAKERLHLTAWLMVAFIIILI